MKGQKLSAICLAVLFTLVEAAAFEGVGAANAQSSPQQDSRLLISHVGVRGTGKRARGGRRGRHKKHRGHHRGRHKQGKSGAQNWNNAGSNPASPWDGLNGGGGKNGQGRHGRRHKRHRGKHKNQMMQMPGDAAGFNNSAGGQFGR